MNKPLLEKLTPAEVLQLLEDRAASLNMLLKMTLADLLAKKVLLLHERKVENRHTSLEPLQITYVKPGKNFPTYRALEHERVFLSLFDRNLNLSIMLKMLVKIVTSKFDFKNDFYRMVRRSPNLADYFSRNFFTRFFGIAAITSKGREAQEELKNDIRELQYHFSDRKKRSPEILDPLREKLNGNLFLFTATTVAVFSETDEGLISDINAHDTLGHLPGGDGDFGSFAPAFDHEFDLYHRTYRGGGGCGNSGCGGDSGCSSCSSGCGSGCGGGGCGGGGCGS
ncbi:MAG: hypothetical protein FD123_2949 [Bacteroidetes bacterium]|nr:MAG: hypothetical protein FD123_2949 [Bacteroidota bacterium]